MRRRRAGAAPCFIIGGAMDDETCRHVQSAMDAGDVEPAEVLRDGIAHVDEVRRASQIEVSAEILELVDATLDAARDSIADFFGCRLGAREGVNLLRYGPGGFYRPHVDRADMEAWPPAARRAVTVVLFLESCRATDEAGGFSGGLLRLHGDGAARIDIVPERGMLVAFPASMPHEVTRVIGGHRDTVVDWYYERSTRLSRLRSRRPLKSS